MRVIDEEGKQMGVMGIASALKAAEERGLDLVEVDPRSEPPVCKIIDYGKYKYRQKKRLHEAHKRHVHSKEIRLGPKTAKHDVEFKIKHARKFLERGDKVLVTMRFRGRELAHTEIGKELLEYFVSQLTDIAKIEKAPKLQQKRLTVLIVKK